MLKGSSQKPYSILALADEVRKQMGHQVLSDDEVGELCEKLIFTSDDLKYMSFAEQKRLCRLVFCSLRCELEILQDLADDPEVTEIMVNGKDNVFYEKGGEIHRADVCFETTGQLEDVIRRLAAKVGREINDLSPIVDARLSDGSRVNAVHSNIAIDGPVLTIRKFSRERMSMEDLVLRGDITEEAAEFLQKLVKSGYNIFVSGGTSSGKTTLLNVLSDFIPPEERIVVIEDSAELAIRGHENLVRMEAKRANAQGKGEVSIRDLIKASLRQRPDRIIIGEVRGGEVVDMLAAMSTGHDGSLSTGHANSPKGMIGRLETMHIASSGFPVEAVRNQIAQAIDIFVHMQRFDGGHRRVTEISEVVGVMNGEIKLNRIFAYYMEKGLCSTGQMLKNTGKLELAGL